MIVEVDVGNLHQAALVHSLSWKESHKDFCSREFVDQHTAARQAAYLAREMDSGKKFYMLVHDRPVAIVSVKDSLIENLYVLPGQQRKGYGSELLLYALSRCSGTPTLWILSNNEGAFRFYTKHGFRLTGSRKELSGTLAELEMVYSI